MLEQFGKLLLKDVSISAIFPAEISGKYLAPYVVSNRTTNQLFVTLSKQNTTRFRESTLF